MILLQTDAETFASWGVDYVKLDGCYSEPKDMDTGYPEFGTYLRMLTAHLAVAVHLTVHPYRNVPEQDPAAHGLQLQLAGLPGVRRSGDSDNTNSR